MAAGVKPSACDFECVLRVVQCLFGLFRIIRVVPLRQHLTRDRDVLLNGMERGPGQKGECGVGGSAFLGITSACVSGLYFCLAFLGGFRIGLGLSQSVRLSVTVATVVRMIMMMRFEFVLDVVARPDGDDP